MCLSKGPASTALRLSPSSQAALSCPLALLGPPCTCGPCHGGQLLPFPPPSLALAFSQNPSCSYSCLTVLVQIPAPTAGFLLFLSGVLPETPAGCPAQGLLKEGNGTPNQGCPKVPPSLGSPWPERVQWPGPGSSQGGKKWKEVVGADTHVPVFAKQGLHKHASKARLVGAGPPCSLSWLTVPETLRVLRFVAVLVSRSRMRHAWFPCGMAVVLGVLCTQNHGSQDFFFFLY